MQNSKLLVGITFLNLALFLLTLSAKLDAQPPIVRAQGLEIVDPEGRLRAQLKVEPVGDTVIFRLITPDGKPRVKLTTAPDGSGLMLLGATDTTHVIVKAEQAQTWLKLRDDERKQKTLTP